MRLSGFTFDYSQLQIWKDRAINGPYKTIGDAFAYSPGSWDDVVTRANKFYYDQVVEYWDGDINSHVTQQYGHYILAAAFYGMVTNNDQYRQKAADAILLQAQNTTNPDFEQLEADYPSNSGNVFHFSAFQSRLFFAFDYTYDLWSSADITTYETWMDRGISTWLQYSNYYPYLNFPDRDIEDYSVVSWWALTGQEKGVDYEYKWTHTDDQGVQQNYTRLVHETYNNRDLWMNACIMLWGLYKNDSALIFDAKRYIKELIMFGTWPDGMIHDDCSNGGYGRAPTGAQWYGPLCIELICIVAELCRRKLGDLELYNFTTAEGIWGSEGGAKNIKLILDTRCELINSTVDRYWDSVSEANRLDPLAVNYRYKSEQCVGPANNHFEDDYIKRTSECEFSGYYYDPSYDYGSYTGQADDRWVGNCGLYACLPLQEYGLFGIVTVTGYNSAKTLMA